ncbi:disintegrin and metalloproteinase domain-containing protein 10 [Xyrichtys novacula]|uniref:Disintegrin and metalloproteinase domain-containing protein 10 n=1 Tax=Xyrichtys novacula TaxID=13765 RepID=A0AAV1EKC6_XYRNO|nr:disintegrin and metalloproteinase domain-containing protein 10 [Xyrichtys novacula]
MDINKPLNPLSGQFENPLNQYIRHYEGLSYDTEALHNSHQRAKRALSPQDRIVHLDFHALGRYFNLRMKRDTTIFSPDLVIEVSGEKEPMDTSSIYSGEVFGDKGTLAHGSVVDGRFEGFIITHHGTYFVEPSERYLKDQNTPFHSVIYHNDDINYPHKYGSEGGCADHSVYDRMRKYQASVVAEPVKDENSVLEEESSQRDPVVLRKKRAAAKEKNICQLFIQTDHTFLQQFVTKEAVLAQISGYVKATNSIYQATDFMGIRDISFMVKRIKINTTSDEKDETNPFRFPNTGIEMLLNLFSGQNHDDYCLAYVFTSRGFSMGHLGLAWIGSPSEDSKGVCQKYRPAKVGHKSFNTGIITVNLFGSIVPPKVSHVTFAHEIGHSLGSPHDSGIKCTPGESDFQEEKEQGNYIMYSSATSGDKPNNDKFSICSIRNISAVLAIWKDDCFVESREPYCGNGLLEAGEECDCGYTDQCNDPCCYSASEAEGKRCKLQPGKDCSPSQGPCCTSECTFKNSKAKCRVESECAKESLCNGVTDQCPASEPKENFTSCNLETQVCLNGVCSGSICAKYGLEVCTCASQNGKNEAVELCHVCCMEKMDPSTCSSSGSEKWAKYFNRKVTVLRPGSPCNNYKGYCDMLLRCRLVDAEGPLRMLRKAIFDIEEHENIADWIVAHWWAVLLMAIALVLLMAGFIKICSIFTPSNNSKLPPPKPVPKQVHSLCPCSAKKPQQRPESLSQRLQFQQKEDYEMVQIRS